jgi:hypothetical protein
MSSPAISMPSALLASTWQIPEVTGVQAPAEVPHWLALVQAPAEQTPALQTPPLVPQSAFELQAPAVHLLAVAAPATKRDIGDMN